MKKLLALFIVSILFSTALAHSGQDHSSVQNESSEVGSIGQQESGFTQMYPEYRSGTIWVVAEVFIVLGAAVLAVRHYFQKSDSSSIKEFISERVV